MAKILGSVHMTDINIVVYERDVSNLNMKPNSLIEQVFDFRGKGDEEQILSELVRERY